MHSTTVALKTNTQGWELEGGAAAETPPHHVGRAGGQAEVTRLSRYQEEPWELALHQKVTQRVRHQSLVAGLPPLYFHNLATPGSLSAHAFRDSHGSTREQQSPRKCAFGTGQAPRPDSEAGPVQGPMSVWHLDARGQV